MTISLKVNGQAYEGWKTARVTRGIDRAAGDFDLGVSAGLPGGAASLVSGIAVGDECVVEVNGVQLITGWVDSIEPSYDKGTHEISVKGRSKTCDLIDCSAMNKPGQWRGLTLLEVAKAIAKPFGINVIVAGGATTQRVADFSLQQGETAHAAIERLCRLQGFLVSDDEDGNLVITRVGSDSSAGALRCVALGTDNNVLQGSATFNNKERFSDYTVKGQSIGDDENYGDAARGNTWSLRDSNVRRYRPMMVVAEGNASTDVVKRRAAWERSTREGKSVELNYTVAGWTANPAGDIWRTNTIANVYDTLLGVQGDFLISEVSFQITEAGSTTQMKLQPPAAFQPEPDQKDSKKKSSTSASVDSWSDEDE